MSVTLKIIQDFMKENNIEDTVLDINKPETILGIKLINKTIKENNNCERWEILMNGPENTYYEKGIFKISIDFPEKYPEQCPEIKFLNKIYHLSVNPDNGSIFVDFLNKWDSKTSKKELLIGIYLFFELGQNPDNSYSKEMILEYKTNINEFIKKAKEWTIKYASPFEHIKNDLKKTNMKNEINLIIDIKDKTVDKKEFFLNQNFEELNKENVEVYINEKKREFSKCFNFPQGRNTILLKFKNKMKNCFGMFKDCHNLINIDLSSFDSSDISNMKEMFAGCTNVININLSLLNTSNVKDMSKMFSECHNLTDLDLSYFDTKNVKDMSEMFNSCYSLKNLDLSFFNLKNVNNMSGMFYNCVNLININIPNDNSGSVENISNMFYGCSSLITILDISNWDTSNIIDLSFLFCGCSSLISLPDIANWNIIKVTNISGIFLGCSSLKMIPDISKWYTKYITNMSYLFYECSSLTFLPDISNWKTNFVRNMSFMFSKCSSLESLPNISNFVTDNVLDMSYMFYNCSSLKMIPNISKWNTKKVINMSYMFYGCSLIKTLPDISNWNIKNVIDISYMFSGCLSLTSLPDFSNWDTQNINNLNMIISNCPSLLTNIDFSKWILPKINKEKLKLCNTLDKNDNNEKINLNCSIKDDNLKYIPQIELKFNNVTKIEEDIIPKLKSEIEKIIKKKEFSIISIRKGSLNVLLTLQYIVQEEIRKQRKNKFNDLSNNFSENIYGEIERIYQKLREHEFVCLGVSKPDDINSHVINITDEKNKEDLKRKILNISDSDDINLYEASKNINMEDLEKFFNNLSLNAEQTENNQKKIINKLESFNYVFDNEIEKALKNSIFEYKIINIFVVEKDNDDYQSGKKNCSNREVKILFHGSTTDGVTGILLSQFHDSKTHIFGKGVYFTDILDYAWYYSGRNNNKENFYFIPKIGDSFSFIASEIYYDKSKKEKVYNCNTRNEEVQKDGLRCAFVNYNTRLLSNKEITNYNGFIGNEFLITEKKQILPLYAITLKRVEYLIIWRDYNFNQNNPNNYNQQIFEKMKKFHENIKKLLLNELNTKIYFMKNTDEAMDLLNRKKYNKIIIITNGNNGGKEFIINARRIIGSNVIAAVSAYAIRKHIKWVKDMENVLLINGTDFHIKFFKSAIYNDINSLNQLKQEIINYYNDIPDFKFREFSNDIFIFPNFKEEGKFEDLKFQMNPIESSYNLF